DGEQALVTGLADLLRSHQLHLETPFLSLAALNPDVELLMHATVVGGRGLDSGDQLWLNRHLVEIAVRQATGRPCFRGPNNGLDPVLVSDVGQAIEIQGDNRSGGFLRTALRSSDILMDRVWQLEMETFQDTPGYIFAALTRIVEPHEDPTALHPEVQRQVANI